jgi:type IV pilus assembly protein PilB
MADPLNIVALDDLKMLTQYAVDPVLVPEAEIRRAIEQVYAPATVLTASVDNGTSAETTEPSAAHEEQQATELVVSEEHGEAPIVKAINQMIREALRRQASDIHIEPMEQVLRVRYRIDGHLTEAHQFPRSAQNTLLTRLKIMSGLDITEWRLPQDGRFKVRLEGHEVDFRVSVLPITHGGKVVLRVLDKSQLTGGLDHLGFLPEAVEHLTEAAKRPHGMILVTGPTGSGKSTTLYAILSLLNTSTSSLITIEDPVEYQLEGITQVPVNPEIGLTFAAGLRAILRQNPDVMMIGEIRDFETADIAMKASLTGHLVLSTLHTNNAIGVIPRLIDMGVDPFLLSPTLIMAVGQRLVRKLCPDSRKKVKLTGKLKEMVQKDIASMPNAMRTEAESASLGDIFQAEASSTCPKGTRGRMGIFEVLTMTPELEKIILTSPSESNIAKEAERQGMISMRQDGILKVLQGLIGLEELLEVI